jgi:hypothetical protein
MNVLKTYIKDNFDEKDITIYPWDEHYDEKIPNYGTFVIRIDGVKNDVEFFYSGSPICSVYKLNTLKSVEKTLDMFNSICVIFIGVEVSSQDIKLISEKGSIKELLFKSEKKKNVYIKQKSIKEIIQNKSIHSLYLDHVMSTPYQTLKLADTSYDVSEGLSEENLKCFLSLNLEFLIIENMDTVKNMGTLSTDVQEKIKKLKLKTFMTNMILDEKCIKSLLEKNCLTNISLHYSQQKLIEKNKYIMTLFDADVSSLSIDSSSLIYIGLCNTFAFEFDDPTNKIKSKSLLHISNISEEHIKSVIDLRKNKNLKSFSKDKVIVKFYKNEMLFRILRKNTRKKFFR